MKSLITGIRQKRQPAPRLEELIGTKASSAINHSMGWEYAAKACSGKVVPLETSCGGPRDSQHIWENLLPLN